MPPSCQEKTVHNMCREVSASNHPPHHISLCLFYYLSASTGSWWPARSFPLTLLQGSYYCQLILCMLIWNLFMSLRVVMRIDMIGASVIDDIPLRWRCYSMYSISLKQGEKGRTSGKMTMAFFKPWWISSSQSITLLETTVLLCLSLLSWLTLGWTLSSVSLGQFLLL